MREIDGIQLDKPPVNLNLRGRRPYLKEMIGSRHITLSDLDPNALNRAIDAGATLQRMGIRVSLGVIDPSIPADRLHSNLTPGEVVLYKEDFHRGTATVNVPYCRETVQEGLNKGLPAQRVKDVFLTDIVPVGR